MPIIKYEGPWEDVVTDRHNVVSQHLLDTDDLTVAVVPDCAEDCDYHAPGHASLRPGEVAIQEAEFRERAAEMAVHNIQQVIIPSIDRERDQRASERDLHLSEIATTIESLKLPAENAQAVERLLHADNCGKCAAFAKQDGELEEARGGHERASVEIEATLSAMRDQAAIEASRGG